MKTRCVVVTVMLLAIGLFSGCSGSGGTSAVKSTDSQERPDWIEKGETSSLKKSMFWLAVGSGDSPEEAAQSARQEVASQIKTRVRARITDILRASGGEVKERFESLSRSITDTQLEGLEILKQYNGRRRSYALAGLNKSVYLGKIESQVSDGYNKARGSFSQAARKKTEGDFLQYVTLCSEALKAIDEVKNPEYFYRSFVQGGTSAGAQALALESTVSGDINDFISSIQVAAEGTPQEGVPGKPLEKPLKAVFTSSGNPVSGFPVIFKTDKGRVSMEPSRVTGSDGSAECKVTYIEKSPVKTIRILASLDISPLPAERFTVKGKEAEFLIQLQAASKWVVYIAESGNSTLVLSGVLSCMRNSGVDVRQLNLQGAFNEDLFVEQASGKLAEYNLIVGSFTAREIDKAMGTSTCRADGYIKGIELSTKRVIFRKSIENVIGVSYTGDASEGCRSALSKAAEKAAEIVKTELGL